MLSSMNRIRTILAAAILVMLSVSMFTSVASAAKNNGLYLSFEEKWVIAQLLQAPRARESAQAFAEMISRIKNMAQAPKETVRVRTFNEFIKIYRGSWPNTGNLAGDLALIEKFQPQSLRNFVADNPDVQKQIDAYTQSRPLRILEMLKIPQQSLPLDKLFAAQASIEQFDLWRKFQDILQREFEKTAEKISALTSSAPGDNNKMGVFIKKAMRLYLENLHEARREYIFLQFLSEDLKMTDFQRMELLIQNSGPQLQKLLQILAHDPSVGPELGEIFTRLQDNAKPISPFLAEQIIKAELDNYNIIRFELEPLAVGTMAELHRGSMLRPDGTVVGIAIRILKPGMAARVEEDREVMGKVAQLMDADPEIQALGLPRLVPLVDGVTKSVEIELDLPGTKIRQRMAMVDYDSEFVAHFPGMKVMVHFSVPLVYDPLKRKTKIMVQELVVGRNIDDELVAYDHLLPEAKRIISEKLAELWIESAIFKSGFYHADLHPGNILVSIREPDSRVFIIDYGMGGKLKPAIQTAVTMIGIGDIFKKPDVLADGIWKLTETSANEINRIKFRGLVAEKMESLGNNELSIDEWVTWALDKGLRLKAEVVNIQRGLATVSEMLKKVGSPLTSIAIAKNLAKKYPKQVVGLAFSLGITWAELAKVGWDTFYPKSSSAPKAEPKLNKAVTSRCEDVLN